MSLTASQTQDIIIIERIASVLSLLGATFVIVTFSIDEKFRKPINRLVFLATFGNILTNVATLISVAGVEAGEPSAICQFQGFLIQWYGEHHVSRSRLTITGSCQLMRYGRLLWHVTFGCPSFATTTQLPSEDLSTNTSLLATASLSYLPLPISSLGRRVGKGSLAQRL